MKCPMCGGNVKKAKPDKRYLSILKFECSSCHTRYDKEGLKVGVGMY